MEITQLVNGLYFKKYIEAVIKKLHCEYLYNNDANRN